MKHLSESSIPKAATDPLSLSPPGAVVSAVTDAEYRIYERLYAYDKTALNAVVEAVGDESDQWRTERISFDAAYGDERLSAFLFLPKDTSPPYQTVLYFPGSWALHARSSDTVWTGTIDFVVKSGRAVCFPIYKGTYERGGGLRDDDPDTTSFYRDHVIMWSKDLSRTIDYLENRNDLDTSKLVYYGTSWGAALGAIFPALEKRLGFAVLDGGGFWHQQALPEADQRTFCPRVSVPVVMINGRYDHAFPVETSQTPMFHLLGTPKEDKKHIVLEEGHWERSNQRIKEILSWLDRYLGPVI